MNPYAPPAAERTPRPPPSPDAAARARAQLRWLAGAIGLVAVLSFMGSVAALLALQRGAAASRPVDQLVTVGVMVGVTALYLASAWALWTLRPYGRALGLVCVVLSVCACPTGTLLTIWGLWVLTRPDVVGLFRPLAPGDGTPAAPS